MHGAVQPADVTIKLDTNHIANIIVWFEFCIAVTCPFSSWGL